MKFLNFFLLLWVPSWIPIRIRFRIRIRIDWPDWNRQLFMYRISLSFCRNRVQERLGDRISGLIGDRGQSDRLSLNERSVPERLERSSVTERLERSSATERLERSAMNSSGSGSGSEGNPTKFLIPGTVGKQIWNGVLPNVWNEVSLKTCGFCSGFLSWQNFYWSYKSRSAILGKITSSRMCKLKF